MIGGRVLEEKWDALKKGWKVVSPSSGGRVNLMTSPGYSNTKLMGIELSVCCKRAI